MAGAELIAACELLFGWSGNEVTARLQLLDDKHLDETFRKRALATHPDRAFTLGLDESECVAQFREAKEAYSRIRNFVERRSALYGPGNPVRIPREGPDNRYWRGQIPGRKLLFGQFLYYSGRISSRELVDAVLWQWFQRPVFGKIACMWGYLESDQVESLLCGMEMNERIGEAALRSGCLTPFKCNAVLGLQRMIQRPIGRYFVEKNIITSDQMQGSLRRFRDHNLTT